MFQSFDDVGRPKIYPADDASDTLIFFGEIEEKHRLGLGLIGLYGDGHLDSVGRQFSGEMLGQEVAPQDSHGVGDPCITHGIKAPKVLVRIDVHLIYAGAKATPSARSPTVPLSAEIEESSIDRIIGSGNKPCFVRAKEKSQSRYLFGFAHAADRLRRR